MMLDKNNQEERKVAVYIRVSTQEQKIDGYGLEAQKNKLLDYIQNNKAQNYVTKKEWLFIDTHTGSDLNREGLQKMLQAVKEKKVDAVIVWKIDRLSRSLQHLLTIFEDFEKNNVSFVSVQENIDFRGPIGKLIFQIFGAIAQFERELIKGRTQMGRLASAEMGNYTGTFVPYGYKEVPNPNGRGKKLAIEPEEKKMVREIFEWYIYDGLGLGEIKNKLNRLKVPLGKDKKNRNGKWTERKIRTMIHNSIYRGEYVANRKDERGNELPRDQWTIVSIPPCISEFTFQQAQQVCGDRKGTAGYVSYLLSGKIVDVSVEPHYKFVGCKRSKGGYSYRRKQFDKGKVRFPVFEVPAKVIEEYVWGKITEALKEPKIFIEKYLAREYSDVSRITKLEDVLSNLRQHKINKGMEIARVEEGYNSGVYDDEKAKRQIGQKNKELAATEAEIQSIEDELGFIGAVEMEVSKLKEASKQVKYRIDSLNNEQKKVLVRLFVDKIELNRRKLEKGWKIDAQVYFKFNPNKFPNDVTGDRTEKGDKQSKNSKKTSSEDKNGATCRNRTDDMLFTKQLLYQLS